MEEVENGLAGFPNCLSSGSAWGNALQDLDLLLRHIADRRHRDGIGNRLQSWIVFSMDDDVPRESFILIDIGAGKVE